MSAGAGKYDDACTATRLATEAGTIALIIIGGNQGSGFSVQTNNPAAVAQLPDLLEDMARQIRADLE